MLTDLSCDTLEFMSTRRDTLRAFAAAAATPVLRGQHQHPETTIQIAKPAVAKYFPVADLRLLHTLVDVIIPATETPGASATGVPLYIDSIAARKPSTGQAIQAGLQGLRAAGFEEATPERRIELLTTLADKSDAFFRLIKDLTVDGYYSSRQGLVTELGYHGNTYLSEFPGCTHPEHQAPSDAD